MSYSITVLISFFCCLQLEYRPIKLVIEWMVVVRCRCRQTGIFVTFDYFIVHIQYFAAFCCFVRTHVQWCGAWWAFVPIKMRKKYVSLLFFTICYYSNWLMIITDRKYICININLIKLINFLFLFGKRPLKNSGFRFSRHRGNKSIKQSDFRFYYDEKLQT